MLIIFGILLTIPIVGCESNSIQGGITDIKLTTTQPDGTKHETNLTVQQPDNPDGNTKIQILPENGGILIDMPSSSVPKAPSQSSINLGRMVMIGGMVILAGGVLAAFGRLQWGLIIGASGAIVMIVSAAIDGAQEWLPIVLIATVVAAIIYGFISWRKWRLENKALVQTGSSINEIKQNMPDVWGKIKPVLEANQDQDVKKKVIAKIKKNE